MSTIRSYAPIQARLTWFRLAEAHGVRWACWKLGLSRKTFYKWRARYRAAGRQPRSLLDQSRRPHHSPRQLPPRIVERILAIRQERECGPRLVSFYLRREAGVTVSPGGVYKVLKRAGQVRPYRTRKRFTQRYTSQWIHQPGQKVQVDVKYCPKLRGFPQRYQYTAIDGYSRLRFCEVYDEVSPAASVDFLARVQACFPFRLRCIQTDHGAEFTYAMFPEVKVIHPFTRACQRAGIVHKLIPIATPHHNGQVENSHGKDVVECYRRFPVRQPAELITLIHRRNQIWNFERPHQALGLRTPVEYLQLLPRYRQAAPNFEAAYRLPPRYGPERPLFQDSRCYRGIYAWKLAQREREKSVT
jgi:transposase InsO family protein